MSKRIIGILSSIFFLATAAANPSIGKKYADLKQPDSILIPDIEELDSTTLVAPSVENTTTISNEDKKTDLMTEIKLLLDQSKEYALQKKFNAALAALEKANLLMPDNYEIQLKMVNILGWQKNYQQAQQLLNKLLKKYPNDSDIQLAQGYLYYYQKENFAAKKIFAEIIQKNPKSKDAKTALNNVNLAISEAKKIEQRKQSASTKEISTPLPEAYTRWRIDTGTEYSALYRTTLANWNQEFLQLTHFFNNNNTAINGRVDRYYQFNEVNTQYSVGLNQKIKPWLNAYFYAIDTPGATFRPIWGFGTGGEMRFNHPNTKGFNSWATVDLQDYVYTIGPAINLNPGLRVEYNDQWDLIVRNINQFQGERAQSGLLIQTHAALTPKFRVNFGVSQAPDIEDLITYTVKSIFTGFSLDITPSFTINVEYIRDDYINAYLRQAFNGTFTFKL